jgi:hypothetical protein
MSSPALPHSPMSANPMRQQLDELDDLLQRMLALPVNQLEDTPPPVPERARAPARAQKGPGIGHGQAESAGDNDNRVPSAVGRAEGSRNGPAPLRSRSDKLSSSSPQGTLVVLQSLAKPDELTVANPGHDRTDTLANSPSSAQATASPALLEPAASLEHQPAGGWGPYVEVPREGESEPASHEDTNLLPEMPPPLLERHQARVNRRRNEEAAWLRLVRGANRAFDWFAIRCGAPGLWLISPRGRSTIGWIGLGMLAAALTVLVLDWIGWTW